MSDARAQHRAQLAAFAPRVATCAGLFRRGDYTEARQQFGELVPGLSLVVAAAGAAEAFLRGGRDPQAAPLLAGLVAAFSRLAPELLSAQERRDWVVVADLLEHELAPQLARWDQLLARPAPGGDR